MQSTSNVSVSGGLMQHVEDLNSEILALKAENLKLRQQLVFSQLDDGSMQEEEKDEEQLDGVATADEDSSGKPFTFVFESEDGTKTTVEVESFSNSLPEEEKVEKIAEAPKM